VVRSRPMATRATVGVFVAVAAVVGAYHFGRARADGVPTVTPLFYGGLLEDNGQPVEGRRDLVVRLWDAASGGSEACATPAAGVEFVGGRFRVPLDGACTGAVRANPNLWAEVRIGGTTFARSKLGAVPYALEAGRASGAAGALETRLAALEARGGGGDTQVVIPSWRPPAGLSTETLQAVCPAPTTPLDGWVFLGIPSLEQTFVPRMDIWMMHEVWTSEGLGPLGGAVASTSGGTGITVRPIIIPPPERSGLSIPAVFAASGATRYNILRPGTTYRAGYAMHYTSAVQAACQSAQTINVQVSRPWAFVGLGN